MMDAFVLIRQLNKGALSVVLAPNAYPTIASGKTSRLERDIRYAFSFLRRYMDRIYDFIDSDVDPVGVGGADVVAELVVAA